MSYINWRIKFLWQKWNEVSRIAFPANQTSKVKLQERDGIRQEKREEALRRGESSGRCSKQEVPWQFKDLKKNNISGAR